MVDAVLICIKRRNPPAQRIQTERQHVARITALHRPLGRWLAGTFAIRELILL
jgi:hypothetical protein